MHLLFLPLLDCRSQYTVMQDILFTITARIIILYIIIFLHNLALTHIPLSS